MAFPLLIPPSRLPASAHRLPFGAPARSSRQPTCACPPQEGPAGGEAGRTPGHSYLVRPTYHLTPRSFAGVSKYPRFLATAEGELATHWRDKRDKAASLRQIDPVMKVELRTVGAGDDDQIR